MTALFVLAKIGPVNLMVAGVAAARERRSSSVTKDNRMGTRTRLIVAVAATFLMVLSVATASAARLSISHGELVRIQTRQVRFIGSGTTQAECDITLEASFHTATVAKIERTLIGNVSRAILGTCNTGRATILTESLPWHIQYRGFNEVLPRPKPKLGILSAKFNVNSFFGNCLATSSEVNPSLHIVEPVYERGGNGIVSAITADSTATFPTTCGINGGFGGSASVFESTGGAQNVLLRLI